MPRFTSFNRVIEEFIKQFHQHINTKKLDGIAQCWLSEDTTRYINPQQQLAQGTKPILEAFSSLCTQNVSIQLVSIQIQTFMGLCIAHTLESWEINYKDHENKPTTTQFYVYSSYTILQTYPAWHIAAIHSSKVKANEIHHELYTEGLNSMQLGLH